MYRTLKLTSYILSSRRMMHCSLWRNTFFFSTIRTSAYRKTDCIHINCDVYGNTSGTVEEGKSSLLPRISNVSRHVYHAFYGFSLSRIYTYVHTYINTFIRIYIYTYVYTYGYICLYVYAYIRLCMHMFIRTFIHIIQRKGKEIYNKYVFLF